MALAASSVAEIKGGEEDQRLCGVLDTNLNFAFSERPSSNSLGSRYKSTEIKWSITLIDLITGLSTQLRRLDIVAFYLNNENLQ